VSFQPTLTGIEVELTDWDVTFELPVEDVRCDDVEGARTGQAMAGVGGVVPQRRRRRILVHNWQPEKRISLFLFLDLSSVNRFNVPTTRTQTQRRRRRSGFPTDMNETKKLRALMETERKQSTGSL